MLFLNDAKKFHKPVPAVIWSIHPETQIITVRPSWDPYTKLILPKSLDDYFLRGHFYTLAKTIKYSRFYPEGTKYTQVAHRVLAFFRQGQFIYPGQNVVIDPWYNDGALAAINYINPFREYGEQEKIICPK
jgi:hypothetical protein